MGATEAKDLDPKLQELAALYGVVLTYVDAGGSQRYATPEGVRAVLGALGAQLEDGLTTALAARRVEHWVRALPPVAVAWDGEGDVELRLPSAAAEGPYELVATTEGGEIVQTAGALADCLVSAAADVGGTPYLERLVPLPDLPIGYHRVELRTGGRAWSTTVIAAPRRVFLPGSEYARRWGVFLPTYALHRQGDDGVGDFGALGELSDWVGNLGGSTVGTLPLLAAFLDEPYIPSPYSPVSRLFWNELYLDVRALPEWQQNAEARLLWESPEHQRELESLRAGEFVDPRRAMAAKRRILERLVAGLLQSSSGRRAELDAWVRSQAELATYARFRATTELERRPWVHWPSAVRDGDLSRVTVGEQSVLYHAYVQWAAHQQLEALGERTRGRGGLGLYLDLPLGVCPEGYDAWRFRDDFAEGLTAGAPPDALFEGGQNWGFAPPHPGRRKDSGHRYFIACLRHHLRYGGVLRLDHIMGLHRVFCIPVGAPGSDGVYVRQHPEELYAVLSLESHRAESLLIGEDLGTVPPGVREAMGRHGIYRVHVQQFALRRDPTDALSQPPASAVASLNTHDTPTWAGFWRGLDVDDRVDLGLRPPSEAVGELQARRDLCAAAASTLRRQGLLDAAPGTDVDDLAPAQVALAASRWLAGTEARLVMASLEDLWGEDRPQNTPGTNHERRNWVRRAKPSLEAMRKDRRLAAGLRALQAARRESMPRPPPSEYAHATLFGDDDLYLFNEGTHTRLSEKLGSHPMTVGGISGTYFAVWAPNAQYVSVVGSFNRWNPGADPLRPRQTSGIWEGFVPGAGAGALYKYHIASAHNGYVVNKADPVGFLHETPPATASVIFESQHVWGDDEWMRGRAARQNRHAPVSIYEVHPGSWRRVVEEGNRPLGWRELAVRLADHVVDLGFTHVELLPVMEHPFFGSWGYQCTGYFAPTFRYGTPDDFRAFVDHLHQRGIGVILDWVPSHFPRDEHGLQFFDGTHLYEHADPRLGFHPDWNSSIFNYGSPEVRSFLISSARFWLEKFHADALRVDAVASMLYRDYSRKAGEWIPNRYGGRENLEAVDFLRQLNAEIGKSFPDVMMIAEESTAWPLVSRPVDNGGLGFGWKWDMGWMHDTLHYLELDPVHRRFNHRDLTFRMMYAYSENFVLSLSHDEVVHGKGSLLGKMAGDWWQKFANLRLLYALLYGMPGKKLLFMGQELAQLQEWSHDRSLDWHLLNDPRHAGIARWVTQLNALYRDHPALHALDHHQDGFEWVDVDNAEQSILAFVRRGMQGQLVLAVYNCTPVIRHDYRIGVPLSGPWRELANSDAAELGGSGIGNLGQVMAVDTPHGGQASSLTLTLPPLAALFLAPAAEAPAPREAE